MNKLLFIVSLLLGWPTVGWCGADKPLLLRKPALSRTHVAFVHGNDLWIVGRQGGVATRLTSGVGLETDPAFSPDGSLIAFTGEYDGNPDVFVIPATGGVPRRLTYHPGDDRAVGWTADGKSVLFRSSRNSYSRFSRLFTMPVEGGFPREVPVPMAFQGSFSPDGTHLAYVPLPPAFEIWKRYRGGRTSWIWLADLADSHVDKIPRENSNDFNPMWVGNRVYFLSDRNGPFTLFAYDLGTKTVSQVVQNDGLDIKSASAGPDAIVYEQFGSLHLFDITSGKTQKLDIRVPGDFVGVRPRWQKVAKDIKNAGISPTGTRAVFEARCEILTVPAEKGAIRNLTETPGVAERDPAWSPDGRSIAYFSDQSGEYQLHVRAQSGAAVKKINLGTPPSFYYSPVWSPDSKKIAYTDRRLNLWFVDVATGVTTRVDTDRFDDRTLDPTWSPDSHWLTYTKQLKNHMRAVFLYELATSKRHQVTDGMSDVRYPIFDKSGKYLYFAASTDAGPSLGSEMAGIDLPITRSVYVAVLNKDLPSPLAPESDEEKVSLLSDESTKAPATDKAAKKSAEPVRIDLEDIGQRILALPIPARNYAGLIAGKSGVFFLLESSKPGINLDNGGELQVNVHRFDLDKRKLEVLVSNVAMVRVSHNGDKVLYRHGDNWVITKTAEAPKPGQGVLALDALEIRVDPLAEWKQMYHEVWRVERDFLYDPGFHGLDLKAAEKKYEPYLDQLTHRQDLNYLFTEMLGELTLGHVYVFGGDIATVKNVPGGLLGADYDIDSGRYRFAHVYKGENWNPRHQAPLTRPGVNVKPGEYLLAVNGRDLKASDNIYSFFEGTAGRQVVIKVGPRPDGANARDVTVEPLATEAALRNLSWIEGNRRKVNQLSGGRLAYIYVPDTFLEGYVNFKRYFFAQVGKEGAVIDERFNAGGIVPDYIIDNLKRPFMGQFSTRQGEDITVPQGAIFGPKAMIINEMAGSGGDELPHHFRQAGIGPLIGKRTWGGLVGIGDYPFLIDGGQVTAPEAGFWFPSGQWEVENHGVPPDIEVEFDPQAVRAGHDPQLEKAVAVVLETLKNNPPSFAKKPAYPNYHKAKGGHDTLGKTVPRKP